MTLTLILGGAASGKSEVAERLAARLPAPVTYVATWVPDPGDADMQGRVAAHRARRPAAWQVRECGADLVAVTAALSGTVLIDSLGPWVASFGGGTVAELCRTLRDRGADTVVVSEEVGLAVHPSSEVGRRFRDTLGRVNQAVAAVADQVWLVVAGRVLVLAEP